MALLDPALAQTWTRHRPGFRPSPQDTDLAFGQVPKTQTFEDLAFSQVLEDTDLAPGQVLRARNRLSPCPCVPLNSPNTLTLANTSICSNTNWPASVSMRIETLGKNAQFPA